MNTGFTVHKISFTCNILTPFWPPHASGSCAEVPSHSSDSNCSLFMVTIHISFHLVPVLLCWAQASKLGKIQPFSQLETMFPVGPGLKESCEYYLFQQIRHSHRGSTIQRQVQDSCWECLVLILPECHEGRQVRTKLLLGLIHCQWTERHCTYATAEYTSGSCVKAIDLPYSVVIWYIQLCSRNGCVRDYLIEWDVVFSGNWLLDRVWRKSEVWFRDVDSCRLTEVGYGVKVGIQYFWDLDVQYLAAW